MTLFRLMAASIQRYRVRFVLTIIAVTIGVSFMAGTSILNDSLRATFTSLAHTTNAGTDVYIQRTDTPDTTEKPTAAHGVDAQLATTLTENPLVAAAWPDVVGQVSVIAADGTAIGGTSGTTLALLASPHNSALTASTGELPTTTHQVAFEAGTLKTTGHTIGDTVTMHVGDQKITATITGEVNLGAGVNTGVVLFSPEHALELFAPTGRAAGIAVVAAPGTSSDELITALSSSLPPGHEAITGTQKTNQETTTINKTIGPVKNVLLVFAAIALLVGAFIIVNTFAMVVASRTHELAVIRALGGSARQVLVLVLAEAFFIGTLGSLFGLGAGISLAATIQLLLAQNNIDTGSISVSSTTIWFSLTAGLVVTLTAAVVPSVRAARIRPIQALQAAGGAVSRSLTPRIVLGAAICFVGVSFVPMVLTSDRDNIMLLLGVCLGLLLTGVLVLIAGLVRPVINLIAVAITPRHIVAHLAKQNTLRSPHRTAITAGALTIGLALLSASAVLGQSASATATNIVRTGLAADLIVASPNGLTDETLTAALAAPGVASGTTFTKMPLKLLGEPHMALATDPATVQDVLKLTMLHGTMSGLTDNHIVISEKTAEHYHFAVGDTITSAVSPDTTTDLIVAGIYAKNPILNDLPVVSTVLMTQHKLTMSPSMVLLTTRDATTNAEVRRDVVAAIKDFGPVTVHTAASYADTTAASIKRALAIVVALLSLSLIVAALGVVNTLIMAVHERTREIGLLRAIGLERRQLTGMIMVESVLIAVFGATLGAVAGTGLGAFAVKALTDFGVESFVVPWGTIVVILAASAVIGILSAIAPAIRAGKLNVLNAISAH